MSLLMWIGVGWIVGYAAALARADWDARHPRRFILVGIGGAVSGGLLTWAAGVGSIVAPPALSTLPAAGLLAVLAVAVYQTASVEPTRASSRSSDADQPSRLTSHDPGDERSGARVNARSETHKTGRLSDHGSSRRRGW